MIKQGLYLVVTVHPNPANSRDFNRLKQESVRMKAASFQGGLALPVPERPESPSITPLPVPNTVLLPLLHHPEQAYELVVKKGTLVKQGQPVAHGVSSLVLAPISGKVEDIRKEFKLLDGTRTTALRITASEESVPEETPPASHDTGNLQKILSTGLSEITDRPVPLFEKISYIRSKQVQTLIINCLDEYFIQGRSAALAAQHTADLLAGIDLLVQYSGAESAVITVYAEAGPSLKSLQESGTQCQILPVKAKYPQHAEKCLVTAVTGREYDVDQTPEDLGVSVMSAETAYWASRAVNHEDAALDKLLTVAGGGLQEPQNCLVRIGTPLEEVLTHLGQTIADGDKVILGNPLSGQAVADLQTPVTQQTHLVYIQKKAEQHSFSQDAVCFKCGFCVEICPMRLMPFLLSGFSEGGNYELAEKNSLFTCIECGCCAYVCPVNIPMVQWIQLGKSALCAQRS